MSKAYLSLGSNIGDTRENILRAYDYLEKHQGIKILKKSSFYKTAPVGYEAQEDFLNAAILIETTLDPYELLEYCHKIEKKLKRKRIIRWGPRTIDIDILLFDALTIDDDRLIIPHPRMHERAFVLEPLKELKKDIRLYDKSIEYYLEKINQKCDRVIENGK